MLKIDSINQRDGIEQQVELQRKGDFQDELQKLESVIRNLSSIQKSEGNQNDNENDGNRSFGFQKLRLRRTNKKKIALDNAQETKEDLTERVQKLKSICKDLKDRLKADEDKDNDVTAAWAVKSPRMESRDDEVMLSTRRENVEEERIAGDRTEVLRAIAACTKVLSNFSMDPSTSNHSMENYEIPDAEIEMTESKFLEVDIDQDTQKRLTDEIELTESKFLEAKISTENATTSMCNDINDCKTIEAIENLVKYLAVDESAEEESEEKEATCENAEETATHDYFCGMSQLWDTPRSILLLLISLLRQVPSTETVPAEQSLLLVPSVSLVVGQLLEGDNGPVARLAIMRQKQEASPDGIGSLTEKEVSVNSVTSTVTTECRNDSMEHLKNPNESSTQDSETVHPTSPEEFTIYPKEENQTDENPENDVDSTGESSDMDDEARISVDCDVFSSLCLFTTTNGETEEAKDSEKEDEVRVSVDFDLSSLDRENTETEEVTVENSKNDDNHIGTPLGCNFFNALGSLTEISTETKSVETSKEKNREKKQDQKPELKVDDLLEITDRQCMTTFTSMDNIREYVVAGFQSPDSQARDEEVEKMRVEGKEAGERAINTVSTMDFIPRIEVVGLKVVKEEPKEEIDNQQLISVSTMDFIPRLEVVGFKERGNSKEAKNVKQPRREGKSMAQKIICKGKSSSEKSEAKIEKLSHKEYRRMAAKNRRNKRKMKRLSKQERKSDALRLGTIQEAPEHLEQPSYDSVYTIDKIQTKGNTMDRETPDPRLVDQDNVVRTTLDNSELDDNFPRDIHKAPCTPQMNDGATDPTSQLNVSRYHRDLVNDDALICNVSSSLSTWTANKSVIKEVNIRQREDCDDDIDYENRLEKKPWFFQSRKEEYDEIVECLSPVLSIPTQNTFGTRNEYGNIEDDDYINHYYDFGEDDVGGNNNDDYEENVDDCEYDHEYYIYSGEEEEEDDDDDDDCYVRDNY